MRNGPGSTPSPGREPGCGTMAGEGSCRHSCWTRERGISCLPPAGALSGCCLVAFLAQRTASVGALVAAGGNQSR